MNAQNLVAWLPFGESTTQDLCGNTWTAQGSPTISDNALQLDGSSYISADVVPIELFNSDFTIHFWMTYKDSKTNEGGFFTTSSNIGWQCYGSKARFNANCTINGSSRWLEIDSVALSEFKDTNHHFAIVRKDDTLYFFFDGTLKKTYTVGTFTGSGSGLNIGARGSRRTAMTMGKFMIHSEALWTQDFTPPTNLDYIQWELCFTGESCFTYDANVVCTVVNALPKLNVWLPFNNYPTEDLCGNWWISTTPNISIHQLSGKEADDNHSVALYLGGETDSAQGKLVLNCQGIYLGGRDFNISFDWWYGGARSFSNNFPFGLWDEKYSAEGSIYIYNHERFNANWNLTSLRAFGQSTPDFNIQYRSWHSIQMQYLHSEGTLVFFCDGSALASLEVTIPRTFFPHVEIERAAPVEHGSGFISNLKISGCEMAPDCANELIYLCVLRNGVVECYPFRAYEFIDYLALAIRYDGRNWYNILRDPSDEQASDFYITHAESTYALTKG